MNLQKIRVGWVERSLAGLNRFANKRGRNTMPAHLTVGIEGEDAVLFYLRLGSSRVDLQACKLEYSIVSPK